MIKFRCQRCGQKIAVDDEGRGVVLACPTCSEKMIAPSQTDREFLSRPGHAIPMELVPKPTPPTLRTPWHRLMMEKLIPALLSQRRELMQTQDAATEQLASIEQRVVLLKMKFQRRVGYYQERVSSLEAENRELVQLVTSLRKEGAVRVTTFGTGRVSLRDAGFLLRM